MHIQESRMIHCGWHSAADITKILMWCAWDCFKVVKEIKAQKRIWTWAAVHCYRSSEGSIETRIIDPIQMPCDGCTIKSPHNLQQLFILLAIQSNFLFVFLDIIISSEWKYCLLSCSRTLLLHPNTVTKSYEMCANSKTWITSSWITQKLIRISSIATKWLIRQW